jgi:hypothetical protein
LNEKHKAWLTLGAVAAGAFIVGYKLGDPPGGGTHAISTAVVPLSSIIPNLHIGGASTSYLTPPRSLPASWLINPTRTQFVPSDWIWDGYGWVPPPPPPQPQPPNRWNYGGRR